jgi:hypothetical protein
MNIKTLAVSMVASAAVFITGQASANTTLTPQPLGGVAVQGQFQPVAFSDSAEAGMLQSAYDILATGDHDYSGHRVKALHAVKVAAKLLGLNLAGDDKVRQPQPLSDARLREAQGLLQSVLGNAEVMNQKRVVKHLNEAINQISIALSIK